MDSVKKDNCTANLRIGIHAYMSIDYTILFSFTPFQRQIRCPRKSNQ